MATEAEALAVAEEAERAAAKPNPKNDQRQADRVARLQRKAEAARKRASALRIVIEGPVPIPVALPLLPLSIFIRSLQQLKMSRSHSYIWRCSAVEFSSERNNVSWRTKVLSALSLAIESFLIARRARGIASSHFLRSYRTILCRPAQAALLP